jgi:hypothetical protein
MARSKTTPATKRTPPEKGAPSDSDTDDEPETLTITRAPEVEDATPLDSAKNKTKKKRGGRKQSHNLDSENEALAQAAALVSSMGATAELPPEVLLAAAEQASRHQEEKEEELEADRTSKKLQMERSLQHKRFQDIEEKKQQRKRKRTDNIIVEVLEGSLCTVLKPSKNAARFAEKMMGNTKVNDYLFFFFLFPRVYDVSKCPSSAWSGLVSSGKKELDRQSNSGEKREIWSSSLRL